MADIKWVRVATDIFDNPKIKYLRSLPKGDTLVLLWLWLIARAGKCNAGGRVYIAEGTPYSPTLIASEIGAKSTVVSQGLDAMERLNMIERTTDGEILILGWEEHQNASGMDKIREQNRERVKRCRERKESETNETACSVTCNVTSNATVTQCNATDKDKEIDKENECYYRNIPKSGRAPTEFGDFWNAYPKKVGRAEAQKAWRKQFPAGDVDGITLPAIERQKKSAQWTKDGGQFIPNPSTWLNQRRWEDELPEPAKQQPSAPSGSFTTDEFFEAALQRSLAGGTG